VIGQHIARIPADKMNVEPEAALPENLNQLAPLDALAQPEGCKESLFGLDSAALSRWMGQLGEPAWRGQQLAEAIYQQMVTEVSQITTLPNALRLKLAAAGWQIGRPAVAQAFRSADGTERYLIDLPRPAPKGETVETVWMPEGDGGDADDEADSEEAKEMGRPSSRLWDPAVHDPQSARSSPRQSWSRATICVSSQVGCAVNCQFCLTAKLGLQRNLTAGEIAGQVATILDRHLVRVGQDRINLVFMGMGEPFLNYDNFMAAVRLLVHEVGLSPQRMTVSTSGIVPGIERFAKEPPGIRPRLAISLNAPNDQIRSEVMPINRKWPIAAVIDAARRVPLRPRERITFEYVLLAGVTDRPEDAREVARLVRRTGLPAKVNLIAWNPGPEFQYSTPKPETAERFQSVLVGEGIATFIRQPRGRDIFAACGQLKRTMEGPSSARVSENVDRAK
jgi:23S rRNA (adenine2503-C2)-methyltransferase